MYLNLLISKIVNSLLETLPTMYRFIRYSLAQNKTYFPTSCQLISTSSIKDRVSEKLSYSSVTKDTYQFSDKLDEILEEKVYKDTRSVFKLLREFEKKNFLLEIEIKEREHKNEIEKKEREHKNEIEKKQREHKIEIEKKEKEHKIEIEIIEREYKIEIMKKRRVITNKEIEIVNKNHELSFAEFKTVSCE